MKLGDVIRFIYIPATEDYNVNEERAMKRGVVR